VSYSQNILAGSAVSVLINQGNGTFAAPVEYPLGTEPAQVVAADLNGDGNPDLAVTSPVHSVVSVLLNQGDGTFAAAVTYGESNFSQAVAAADLNGDGRIDLFVPGSPLLNTGCLP
jgi:hypothetical protein